MTEIETYVLLLKKRREVKEKAERVANMLVVYLKNINYECICVVIGCLVVSCLLLASLRVFRPMRCGNLLRAVISISAVISMRGTRFPGIITSYPDKLKIIRIILGEESEIGFGTTENRSKTGRRTKR